VPLTVESSGGSDEEPLMNAVPVGPLTSPATADPRRWWSLVGLCAVTALVWVTASDISIALPTIGKALGGSMDTLQWAVNGYYLAGALIIVGGRVADVFGRRIVFGIGTLAVMVGSIIAGLSQDTLVLIVGRVIEGVGAAAVLPSALAIVAVSFTGREKDTAVGAWIATCWGAQALGPLVGGALIDVLSWQWIFWINLPIGSAALALTWWATPETRRREGDSRIDLPGAATLVAALFLISYGLVRTDTDGALLLGIYFGAAIVLLGAFVEIERHARSPLVVLSIFRRPRFDGAVLENLNANFIFGAVIFFMSLYLQVVELKSPLVAGALLLPATIPILLLNPIGTRWGRRSGPWLPTVVGMVVLAAAGLLLTDLTGAYSQLLLPFILLGVGVGLQITPCAEVAVEDAVDAGEGVASGVYKTSSMIGGSLGVAASTAIFQTSARNELELLLASANPDKAMIDQFLDVMTGSVSIDSVKDIPGIDAQQVVTQAFDVAVAHALWPSILCGAFGVVIAVVLLRHKGRRRGAAEELVRASGGR
jgi:EmrB/QacA subfamily drug resistance transporter